ncbi:DUF1775 domain-containing protein [Streptomyces sp. NPDC048659]|uniref:DUF1775 domain-containing protein n=1 Tax=Streptomyces sp. NPDC048659 TaxID=3155489 RepID=UPI0034379CDC
MPWTSRTRSARRPGAGPDGGAAGRVARAGVFSCVGTVLAATAHHLASGHAPAWGAAPTGAALLFPPALVLVHRPRAFPTVAAATLAAQALLHTWFAAPHTAHGPHGPHGAAHGGWGGAMAAAHALAALAVAWLMQRADTAVRAADRAVRETRAALAALRAGAPGRPVPPLPPDDGRRSPPPPPRRRTGTVPLKNPMARRGPPWRARRLPGPARHITIGRRSPTRHRPAFILHGATMSRTTRRARVPLVAAATLAASIALATPASAHVEVEAKGARALAENVELSFNAESESTSSGITKLEVVLPEGLKPADIAYKSGPSGWRLTPTARGYAVSGPAVAVGEPAAYKVLVRKLPDARSLAFKTLQTYGDGRVDRWIEVEKAHETDGHAGNPAPTLNLGPAATTPPATTPPPTPTATTAPTTEPPSPTTATPAPPKTSAEEPPADDTSAPAKALTVAGVIVLLAALAGAWWWHRRRGRAEN